MRCALGQQVPKFRAGYVHLPAEANLIVAVLIAKADRHVGKVIDAVEPAFADELALVVYLSLDSMVDAGIKQAGVSQSEAI